MSRYIDAEKLTKEEQSLEDIGQGVMEYYAVEEIENAPTADVVEVKHGRWIVQGGEVVCSKCFEPNLETNYCPNCGAKMDESEEEDEQIH